MQNFVKSQIINEKRADCVHVECENGNTDNECVCGCLNGYNFFTLLFCFIFTLFQYYFLFIF